MEEFAMVLILLALVGIAIAYSAAGMDGVKLWFKLRLVGAPEAPAA